MSENRELEVDPLRGFAAHELTGLVDRYEATIRFDPGEFEPEALAVRYRTHGKQAMGAGDAAPILGLHDDPVAVDRG